MVINIITANNYEGVNSYIFSNSNKYDPFWENVPKCADKYFSDLLIKA